MYAIRSYYVGGDLTGELLRLLDELGVEGAGFSGASEAQQALAASRWDLLICTGPVPGELAGWLRQQPAEQRPAVLAVLESAGPAEVLAAVRAGIDAYGVWPLDAESLGERLALALGRAAQR